MSKLIIPQYLDLLESQREAVFTAISDVERADLWRRPQPEAWSMGEHIDHARTLLRYFRRLLLVLWPVMRPYAGMRRSRPYPHDIDDVYERPNFPLNVGWMFPAEYNPQKPAPLAALHDKMTTEHQAIRAFFEGKEEQTLGNFYLYDPAIGWLNMVQMLRVGVHHDEHHFRQVREIWQSGQYPQPPF